LTHHGQVVINLSRSNPDRATQTGLPFSPKSAIAARVRVIN
jgi:hypothetical protein